MSPSSSSPSRPRRSVRAKLAGATGLIILVVFSFVAAQAIVFYGWRGLEQLAPAVTGVSDAVAQLIFTASTYLLTLLLVVYLPRLARRPPVTARQLGVRPALAWVDLALAPAAFIVYMIASSLVLALIFQTVPGLESIPEQQIGFDNLITRGDFLVAFLALVIIAPLAEELLFRGYLYGRLRGIVGALLAAVLTSALFGAIHGQWGVAVDTFVLSLVMCGLREITGTIWAGTLVHMLKNGLAFFTVFIYPVFGP